MNEKNESKNSSKKALKKGCFVRVDFTLSTYYVSPPVVYCYEFTVANIHGAINLMFIYSSFSLKLDVMTNHCWNILMNFYLK